MGQSCPVSRVSTALLKDIDIRESAGPIR